jgi:3'-phosphoadenosine 5'-phosphosulfate sulfotransferase (PAPS reductase)/FAD synthetase
MYGGLFMTRIEELEHRSIYVIREAYAYFKRPAVLWWRGKEFTVLMSLCCERHPTQAFVTR